MKDIRSATNDEVLGDVATFLQLHGHLEMFCDDLLCLANSRRDRVSGLPEKYPVRFNEKISTISVINASLSLALFDEALVRRLVQASELRNLIGHGVITEVCSYREGHSFVVEKMGLPEKRSDGTNLLREKRSVAHQEIWRAASTLVEIISVIETVRQAVFFAGDGWPTYISFPLKDPFGIMSFPDRLAARVCIDANLSTENIERGF